MVWARLSGRGPDCSIHNRGLNLHLLLCWLVRDVHGLHGLHQLSGQLLVDGWDQQVHC
jgi:hypothetical protein